MVNLTPRKLNQKLRVIDQFIAEAEPAIAAWRVELSNRLDKAQSAHRALDERWRIVAREVLEHSKMIRCDIEIFCQRSYDQWRANTSFIDRLFVEDNRPSLASHLDSWLNGTNFPSEVALLIIFGFKWDDLLKTPISSEEDLLGCGPQELLALRAQLQPKLNKRVDFIVGEFRSIIDLVESSESIGRGGLLSHWKEWKFSMSVCVGDIAASELDESLRKTWDWKGFIDSKCFQPAFPALE